MLFYSSLACAFPIVYNGYGIIVINIKVYIRIYNTYSTVSEYGCSMQSRISYVDPSLCIQPNREGLLGCILRAS